MQDSQGNRSWVQRGVVVCAQLNRAQDAPLEAACQSCQHSSCLFLRGLRNWRDSKEKLPNSERIGLGHPIPQSAVVAKVFGRYPTVSNWRCLLQLRLHQPLSRSHAVRPGDSRAVAKAARKSSTKPRRGTSKIFSAAHGKFVTCSRWTRQSVSIFRKACVQWRVPSVKESIAASVVVVTSRTMSAIASNRRSRTCPEKHSHSLLRRMQLCCGFRQSLHL